MAEEYDLKTDELIGKQQSSTFKQQYVSYAYSSITVFAGV